MDTNTHDVKAVTVTEREHGHFKIIRVLVVATVPRWCEHTLQTVKQELKHEHTFFTNDLDLKVEFQESEE
tara:strand:+ start:288 stop:497 length:210 start_codon:yes stop_codon:yes gene_type:complete